MVRRVVIAAAGDSRSTLPRRSARDLAGSCRLATCWRPHRSARRARGKRAARCRRQAEGRRGEIGNEARPRYGPAPGPLLQYSLNRLPVALYARPEVAAAAQGAVLLMWPSSVDSRMTACPFGV